MYTGKPLLELETFKELIELATHADKFEAL